MNPRVCRHCLGPLPLARSGPTPKYCCAACKQAAYRKRTRRTPERIAFADWWSKPRWVRAVGKRPVTVTGTPASSTDPATWTTRTKVMEGAGDGYGIMLGDGLGCIDLDRAFTADGSLTPAAKHVVALHPDSYIEVSRSGKGLHIFGTCAPARGVRTVKGGTGVEMYSQARFILMTGEVFQPGGLAPLAVDELMRFVRS